MKDFIIPFFTILALTALSFYAGRKSANQGQNETIVERVDTLVVRDTIVTYKPKYISKRVVDSIYVPVREVVVERDTIKVLLEREQVVWEDSLARVYASGILPKVDSIHHYRDKMVITKETIIKTNPKWGVGI